MHNSRGPIALVITWLGVAATLSACGGDGGGGGGGDVSRVRGYIRAAPYSKLILEIDSVAGFAPRPSSQQSLISGLGSILAKPGGITADVSGVVTSKGTDHAWTFAELESLATASSDVATATDTTKIHVMFVDGHYAEDSASGKILGIAWANTHLVMFKQTIESTCASAGLLLLQEKVCAAAELAVWTHEIGHIIGLVDTGLAMTTPHKDSAHGNHDQSDQCVMYWAYEGAGVVDLFKSRFTGGNESPMGFDPACLADIEAVKNAP